MSGSSEISSVSNADVVLIKADHSSVLLYSDRRDANERGGLAILGNLSM